MSLRMQFLRRKGTQYLADFYALTIVYDKNNPLDKVYAENLLPIVAAKLANDIRLSVITESRHHPHLLGKSKKYSPSRMLTTKILEAYRKDHHSDAYYYYYDKTGIEAPRYLQVHNVIKLCSSGENKRILDEWLNFTFNKERGVWGCGFGGKAWGDIFNRYLDLQSLLDSNCRDWSKWISTIDVAIDTVHNGGVPAIEKSIPDSIPFLNKKSRAKNPYWLVNKSCISRHVKKRLKERYNVTETNCHWSGKS